MRASQAPCRQHIFCGLSLINHAQRAHGNGQIKIRALKLKGECKKPRSRKQEAGTQYLCQGLSIRIGEQSQYGAFPLR